MPNQVLSANGLPFDRTFWEDMYTEDDESLIDGVYNSKEHVKYLYSILELLDIPINSIGDFGFGLGILLKAIVQKFQPERIIAIDPSTEAVQKLLKAKWHKNYTIAIKESYFQNYDTKYLERKPLDLAILYSVLQYFPDADVKPSLERLSKICKYLYISVPTKEDYADMKKDLNFTDPYAYSRPASFYHEARKDYFEIVSYNLWESKKRVKDSSFQYKLFRL